MADHFVLPITDRLEDPLEHTLPGGEQAPCKGTHFEKANPRRSTSYNFLVVDYRYRTATLSYRSL